MLRVTGIPRSRITALKTSLSIASAEPSTPAPTYGTPASSSRPWTVPSSPNGPCRTGKTRSEEHTSELQSQSNLVCRLLLEKKKHDLDGADTIQRIIAC